MSETVEIWESTLPGRIDMTLTDPSGRKTDVNVSGVGRRLRLTGPQREIVEEGIRLESLNPFRNGHLVRADGSTDHAPSLDEVTDEDLVSLFSLDEADFTEAVASLSEVNVRRLGPLVKASGTVAQAEIVKKHTPSRSRGGRKPAEDPNG